MTTKENFHSFDALRFFSFFIVFLSHLPYLLFQKLDFLHLNGSIGVKFFFILSGFLITYILVYEKSKNNSIDLKRYFIRRILRIWPLYYLMLLFAFLSSYLIRFLNLGSSKVGYEPNWLLSCLFLENYKIIFHNQFANVSPLPVLWSLCIEEHFYIIWGLIIYFISLKKIPLAIIILILIAFVSRYFYFENNLMFKDFFTNIDYFMYGAIPAYLLIFQKEKTLFYVDKIPSNFKKVMLILPIIYVFTINYFDYEYMSLIEPIMIGLLFTSIIFIFIPKENKFKINQESIFSKLGIYTYSLYLNHVIVINLMIQVFKKMNLDLKDFYLLFIIVALISTILASKLTYVFIEKPFLNLKNRF